LDAIRTFSDIQLRVGVKCGASAEIGTHSRREM
jgi:hypothetical protein